MDVQYDIVTYVMMIGIFLFGMLAGYFTGSARIVSYLKKYYPEVNFRQKPKERLKKIEGEKEKREQADKKKDEKSEKNK